MNRDIQEVESNLTDVGRRCNPSVVEKTYAHLCQIRGEAIGKGLRTVYLVSAVHSTRLTVALDIEKRAFAAQLALLHRCITSISKLLRKRGSLLLIAKLMAVSRLLHNTLSQQDALPPFLKSLRVQLDRFRESLRRRIYRRLASADSTIDDLLEALAAYCLGTSSSDDAVRHFHQIRVEVIGKLLDSTDLSGQSILKALRLYIETLRTSKTLLSRRLSDALAKLKARPILTDPEIRNLDDLDLGVLGRFVSRDVKNFTPWIKLSEWAKPEAEKTIKQWSSNAFRAFVEGSQKNLAGWDGFSELLSLRRQLLEMWLSSRSSIPTHSPTSVLEDIRSLFNRQLTRVLHAQAKKLEDLGRDVLFVTENWEDSEHTEQLLWDHDLISLDYSNGATHFKQAVMDRYLGWDEGISAQVKDYEAWLGSIEHSRKLIEDLRRVRWVDILDDGEDEDTAVDVTSILNEDDPQILVDTLGLAVKQALDGLQSSLSDAVSRFGASNQSDKAGFLLRLIRQIRGDLPVQFISSDFAFSSDIVPELQRTIVAQVTTCAGPLNISSELHSRRRQVPGRTLWEGDPALPIQPLPSTFKFLRRLMTSMTQCGSDLWDPSTVKVLKMAASRELSTAMLSAFEGLESLPHTVDDETSKSESNINGQSTDNGGSAENPKPEGTSEADLLHDQKIQLLFDTVYLASALATSSTENSEFASVIETLEDHHDPKTQKSVKRTAEEYWKRTELLFGLLAAH